MKPNIKHLLAIIGVALSALFLWLALRSVDRGALWAALRSTNPWWIAPFLCSLAAFCWLKSWRWALLLTPTSPATAGQLIGPVVIGYMGTGLMPMQLGEVARAYIAATTLNTRVAAVLTSLLVERILDVFVLLIILGLVAAFGTGLDADYRWIGTVLAVASGGACVALWLYATHTEIFIRLIRGMTSFVRPTWQQRIVDQLEAGAMGLQILRQPGRYLQLAGISIVQWSFMCFCTWISLAAVGESLPPIAALAVLATTIVSMTLPSGPGYVGALQLAYVIALTPFGVDRSQSLAASFFYLAALWVPLVACGIFLLHRTGLRWRNVANAAAGKEAA